MVIKKPMLLTNVNVLPLNSAGALAATKLENMGESATTNIPQKSKKAMYNSLDA